MVFARSLGESFGFAAQVHKWRRASGLLVLCSIARVEPVRLNWSLRIAEATNPILIGYQDLMQYGLRNHLPAHRQAGWRAGAVGASDTDRFDRFRIGSVFPNPTGSPLIAPNNSGNGLVVDFADGTFTDLNNLSQLIADITSATPSGVFNPNIIFGTSTGGMAASGLLPTISSAVVPLPSTFALAIPGLVGLLAYGWRRRRLA